MFWKVLRWSGTAVILLLAVLAFILGSDTPASSSKEAPASSAQSAPKNKFNL